MSKEARVPTVWVYPKAYYTMSYWAKLAGKKGREMICFARCILEDGDAVVTDVYMVKHEGNAGAVDADDDDVVRLMMELNAEGVPPEEAFRCWVHSHPGTGPTATYLSGTDEDMIERFMSGEFLVSIVWDQAGGSPFCRIDYKNPRVSVVADIELYLPYLTAEELKEAEEEYEDKSRAIASPTSKYSTWKPGAKTTSTQRSFTGYGSGGDSADYDYDESGWMDRRTGSYTTNPPGSSSRHPLAFTDDDDEAEDKSIADIIDIDGMDEDDLRSQMAEVFELEDEEVQQQWLDWLKEDPAAFQDMLVLSKRDFDEAAAVEYEITDEKGHEIVMIDLIDDDRTVGATVETEGEEPEEPEESEESSSEDARNMDNYLRENQDIDSIAMRVADGDVTKEEGMELITARHEVSEDEANEALEVRIG